MKGPLSPAATYRVRVKFTDRKWDGGGQGLRRKDASELLTNRHKVCTLQDEHFCRNEDRDTVGM